LDCYNQALALRREMGARSGVAPTLGNAAIVRFLLGDLAGASTAIDAALALARATRQQRVVATVLYSRGNLARLAGDFAAAERDHREVAAIEPARAADVEAAIAMDLIEAGRKDDALAVAPRIAPAAALQIRAM